MKTVLRQLQTDLSTYESLAMPVADSMQLFMLAELRSRIAQCIWLLNRVLALEEQFYQNYTAFRAGREQGVAHSELNESFGIDEMRLHTESFYWVAHRGLALLNYKVRLPELPRAQARGVTLVRNWFLEHQWSFTGQIFSFGGLREGPVLRGGTITNSNGQAVQDPGLYFNAVEWAESLIRALTAATATLSAQARP